MDNGVIAGIKDSSASSDRMQSLVDALGHRIAVMAASDSFATEGRKLGAQGFISALANIWPASFVRLWGGDETLQPAVDAVRAAVKQCGGIPALKALAGLRGYPMGPARVPHAPLGEGKAGLLEKAFAAATEAGLA
jgi:dihydrodipicolinate synthase/N-acetylneuraminate lyase